MLYRAIYYHQSDLVKILIESKIDVNQKIRLFYETSLEYAENQGSAKEIIDMLIEAGAKK